MVPDFEVPPYSSQMPGHEEQVGSKSGEIFKVVGDEGGDFDEFVVVGGGGRNLIWQGVTLMGSEDWSFS